MDEPAADEPERLREEIEQLRARAHALAAALARAGQGDVPLPGPTFDVLALGAAGVEVFVPLVDVAEVVLAAWPTAQASADPAILGTLDFGGTLVTVVSLGGLFDRVVTPMRASDRIVRMRAHGGRVALHVESAHDVFTIERADVRPAPHDAPPALRALVPRPSGPVGLLSSAVVARRLEEAAP